MYIKFVNFFCLSIVKVLKYVVIKNNKIVQRSNISNGLEMEVILPQQVAFA